ncbi:MAG: pyridoxamine 5'-phosphate oxidase family protein [Polyangiaceae bacterium]
MTDRDALPTTERTRLHRRPQRGSHELALIRSILDEALVCHVGFSAPHGPVVLPTTFVRIGDALYLHGSPANAMLGRLATGVDACVTVTLIDGLVLGRTALHHSMNYRSVVMFGRATPVTDADAKARALEALVERAQPGRSRACRPPNARELAGVSVLELPILEASAKVRKGPPLQEEGEDAALPYWSGVIPISLVRGEPIPCP